jgi:hypothetical protein
MAHLDGCPVALSGPSAKLPARPLMAASPLETGAWDASGAVRQDAAGGDSWERRVAGAGRLAALAPDVPAPDARWLLQAFQPAQRALEASTEPCRRAVARSAARSYEVLAPAAARASQPLAVEPQWTAAASEKLEVAALWQTG